MQTISDTIRQLHPGQAETFEGLTVLPLFGASIREPDYLTLDEALARKQARVIEVSEGGEVPNLLFENLGDRKVLLVDGDELVGAKQNRIINLSILVAAHSKIEIPVSCVEAGRWSYRSREFESRGRSMYAEARAAKAAHVTTRLRRAGERYAEQDEVWNHIAACASALDVDSPTSAMEDIFDRHEDRLRGYREAFQAREGQVGAVFAVNGKVRGIELFDSPHPFRQYLERLVGSYAIEAMQFERGRPVPVPEQATLQSFLGEVATADTEAYPALGLGEDLRLAGETLAGGVLVAEERVVHLAAFHIDEAEDGERGRVLRFRGHPV